MSSKTPVLPPIKKQHRLNIEKASNQVLQNFIACHDSGNTSVLYKLTAKNHKDKSDDLPNDALKLLKTTTTGSEFMRNKARDITDLRPKPQALVLESLNEWRKNIQQFNIEPDKILRVDSEIFSFEGDNYSKQRKPTKASNVLWEELQAFTDPSNAINYIIEQRKIIGWNIQLPVHGNGAKEAMENYVDRDESNFKVAQADSGQFKYCLCLSHIIDNILYEPYELRIISGEIAKSYEVYYTVSATSVIRITNNDNTSELTPAMKWLWEKKIFDILRQIKIFRLFRKRKTFRNWFKHIRETKQYVSRDILRRRLFCANEVFQSVLLHVRTLCERASNSLDGSGVSGHDIIMINYDFSCTYTLEEFNNLQNKQCDLALSRLNALKEEIIKLSYISCITVGELEGIDFEAFFNSDTFKHRETFIEYYLNMRQTKTTRMRDMHLALPARKGTGPSYSKRKEWRFILKRICEFLRSVDYLIQELLHRVVKTSVRHLFEYVNQAASLDLETNSTKKISNQTNTDSLTNEFSDESSNYLTSTNLQSNATIQPRTHTDISAKTQQLNLDPVKTVQDIERILDDIKLQSKIIKTVEPIFNVNLVLNVEENTENVTEQAPGVMEEEEFDDDESSDQRSKKSFDVRVYVSLSPNQNEFKNFFRDLISKYEETAGKIQTLLYEEQFKVFYEIPIYELTRVEKEARLSMNIDDIVQVDSKMPWPEVEFLFGEDEEYQCIIAEIMHNVTISIQNVTSSADSYKKYCNMVASTLKLNIEKSLTTKKYTPDEFQFLLSKHTEQIQAIKSMKINRRVGIFNFHGNDFQEKCLPFPTSIISAIDNFLPQTAIKRNEKLQETMRDALKMLDKDPGSVEDFVEHLAVLTKINNELFSLEKEFITVTRLFAIAYDYNLKIDPEQYAFFKSLATTFNHLKSSLLYTEAQAEENIRRFTIDLSALMAKVHDEAVELRIRLQFNEAQGKKLGTEVDLLSAGTTFQLANENLSLLHEMIEKLLEKSKNYSSYQERFSNALTQVKKKVVQPEYSAQDYNRSGISITTLQSELNELEHDINLRKILWKSIEEWDILIKKWLSNLIDDIKVDVVQKEVNKFTQNIYMLEKGLPPNELVPRLKIKVLDFKKALPIIVALRNQNLKFRHYQQIKHLIGIDLKDESKKFTLSILLDVDVLQYRERISDISALATNEATLEGMLSRIIDLWKKTDFRLVKDHAKDTFIITATDEIQILLEESQVTMTTIKSSIYVGPIKTAVEDWDRRLTLFSKTLDEWIICQKKWLYLKQIFSAPDIQRQLVSESKIFNSVEKFWKDLMRRTDDKPNALRAATAPSLFEQLQSYAIQMEKIQRSLEDYFETKRLIFPRLYFLSNEDLLDILSQSKEPQKIQPHLNKCFGNINGLEVSTKILEITHLISTEGEKLEIAKPVRVRGATEQWLGAMEAGMQESIRKHLKNALQEYTSIPYKDWIIKQAGQITLLVSQINFNIQVISCFDTKNPAEALGKYYSDLINTINMAASVMSKELSNDKTLTIEALLTIEVHSRDTLTDLIKNKISKADDFEWSRHLRYEWDDINNQCTVKQSDSFFIYGYEYLGCSPRLVITPLTDRCYLTLTGALKLNLGGAPAGPAGTGKTETVKDLAKSVGKLCLVFNCSEGLDYKMLGKFFSGLCQSGSWCCFDEFNRIDIEVLSVVAQQMLTIKTAKDSIAPRFTFEGREIKMNNTCGFFITMNPTYAGRVELPDNLKPLYRPVAMMVPDYALIGEIILFSLGFRSAEILALKIVTLYDLASRQLSLQDHYDFGLRTIKAVLSMAGQIKKAFMIENSKAIVNLNSEQESQILMQALFDTNLPKFLRDDVVLFQNIMNDLFPQMTKLNKNQDAIEKAIHAATRDLSYQSWPSQTEKIMQLYDQMLVRHGIMLVGPTGGGKTVARTILQKALSLLPIYLDREKNKNLPNTSRFKKGKIESITLNPKSITIGELYGVSDPNTLEWTDGIFGNAIRNFFNAVSSQLDPESESLPAWQFMILDGPVDNFWVENLNSVLDDSKVLCLASGERINLTTNTRLIFEVDSLAHTSPATVSRCAMVYFEPRDLGITPWIKNWFNNLPPEFPKEGIDDLKELLDFSLNPGFEFIEIRKGSTTFNFIKQNVLNNMFTLIQVFIDFFQKNGGFDTDTAPVVQADVKPILKKKSKSKTDLKKVEPTTDDQIQYFLKKNPKQLITIVSRIYIFAYIWSFGGVLKREDNAEDDNIINQKSHVKSNFDSLTVEFSEMVHELFGKNVKYGLYLPPSNKPVFDYFLDVITGNFIEWNNLIPTLDTLIRKTKSEQLELVETIDSVRFTFITTLLLMGKKPVLITGSSGIGKTMCIKNMLRRLTSLGFSLKPNSILDEVFNFSAKKSSANNQMNSMYDEEEAENDGSKKNKSEEITLVQNTVQFSALTSSNKFLSMFISKLSKKANNTLGAPKNKFIITFIDDLSIPMSDKFGDQPPLELLRFIIQNDGFHDIKNGVYKGITDNTFLLCCGPPKNNRNVITPRLLRQLAILSMPDPSARALLNIYQVQLGRFFLTNEFNNDIRSNLMPLVSSCIVMYYRIFISMLPTPKKSHYIFNLRDLSKLVTGLMQASSIVIINKDHLVELFVHESIRIFNDRLVSVEDNKLFYNHLSETVADYFKVHIQNPFYKPVEQKSVHSKQVTQKLKQTPDSEENADIVLYGDFMKSDERIYQPLKNWKQIVGVLSDYQMRSSSGFISKQIVFFKEAVEHICRACRVLRQPKGHLIQIGLDGTGKNTIMGLAAIISNCEMFKLNVKKGYCFADFREDLKSVFKIAAVQRRRVVFFIADKDIYEEIFLEDIDSLLSSGNIPDLFDPEELDAALQEIKTDGQIEGILVEDKNELNKYLISRLQANLHIVLSMSPVGNKFRERCSFHPALVNCTTIDWYNDWSEAAMEQVSNSFLESMQFNISSTLSSENQNEIKSKISQVCVYMHTSLIKASRQFYTDHKRHYYVTPSCFIDLLHAFRKIFESKKGEYIESLSRLRHGLHKLTESNDLIGIMKEELIEIGPQIEMKQKETEKLMEKLAKDQKAVNEVASIVYVEEEKMRLQTEMVAKYAEEAEKDLAGVIPILALARESLNALNKADISEIRVYNSPPYLVMTVMCAICIILNKKADWNTSKQLLSDPGFLNSLINFNAEQITDLCYRKFRQYSKLPDFKPALVGRVSKACESLCAWVLAVEKFHEVYRSVKPKEIKVNEANEALTVIERGLKKKQKLLEKIEEHLENFKKQYEESLKEKQQLEERKELMRVRLIRASELTSALNTEKVRWAKQYEELQHQSDLIIGHSLVSAAAVNYLGAMTQDYRTNLVEDWLKFCSDQAGLLVDSSFDLCKNVVEQHVTRTWIHQKLPDDQNSIENAIFLKYSLKWPLIIDPQNQVVRWIKEMEGINLKTCKIDDPLLFRTLEQTIRLGGSILVENVNEYLDPLLDPILRKEIVTRGAQKIVRLGENEIEWNDQFRIYLVTSLPNPHFLPNTFIKVNLINFTITFKCLFEQFLSLIVLKEKPELEKERTELLESISKDFLTLKELEDKSLSILSSSDTETSSIEFQGQNILDDQDLIDVLTQSKHTSYDISIRLNKNEETEKNLNLARQKYSAIAIRASILYFSVQNASSLNVMYQFSLSWFYNVFQSCLGGINVNESAVSSSIDINSINAETPAIDSSLAMARNLFSRDSSIKNESVRSFKEKEDNFETYIDSIILSLTQTVYQVVSWALFAEHKLTFSLSICVNILKDTNNKLSETITPKEYSFFLNSTLLADMQLDNLTLKIKSSPNEYAFANELLIDEKTLRQILLLEDIFPHNFKSLCENMKNNLESWSAFFKSKDPYEFMSLDENNISFKFIELTKFQKLILIKILRSDALMIAVYHFVNEILGPKFLDAGIPTLHQLYHQSLPHTPIIFILSPGSDPTNQLLRYARDSRGSTLHMDIVSLGQGQGPRAEELITKSFLLKGRWIFLQNCHLCASFMPRLSVLVNNLNRTGVEIDKQFRLFLSSKPDNSFPISLLKSGIKMTIESPRGIKNNLKQNFGIGGFVNKRLFESTEYGPSYKRLLFGLGFIHALIHERKKFGHIGWNLPYEFNNSDLEVAILQLQSILSLNQVKIPFSDIIYITGEVIYGGRVTDDFDRRCLLSILNQFFCEKAILEEHYYDHDKNYKALSKTVDFNGMMEYIENLPDDDDPSLFGMNIYAQKMLLSNRAESLIENILSMEPLQAASNRIEGRKNDEEIVFEKCNEIISALPVSVSASFEKGKHLTFEEALEKLKERLGKSFYENSAMITVMSQEIQRYNKLLETILKTTNELIKALKGEIMMSSSTENIFNSFLLQKIPKVWENNAYPSLKPLASWIKNLIKRVFFFSLWSKKIISFAELTTVEMNPSSFWLSSFFYPQGLLASISQNYARKHQVSIDSLKFKYEILNNFYDENEVEPELLFHDYESKFSTSDLNRDGVILCGFYFDGGKWSRNDCVVHDSPQRFTPVPHFLCRLVNKNEEKHSKSEEIKLKNVFKCAVYRNSVRAGNSKDQSKNYITSIDINCNEDPEHWIMRGLCMILQTDD